MERAENEKIISLIQGYRGGDESAFEQLVMMFRPMIDGVIRHFELDVDETFSEACMGFLKAVQSYNPDNMNVTFGLYAKICIERRLIDVLRKKGTDINARIDSDVDVDEIAVSGGVQAMLEHREQTAYFMKVAREELSSFEYEVYRCWMLGYKSADIARMLNTTAKSVDNAKNRMMAKLKRRLTSQ